MTTADRNERIRALAKVALAILRRNAAGVIVDKAGFGRARAYDVQHNECRLSFLRLVDDPAQTAQLEIRFAGHRVLFAEWNDAGFVKRSYMPGPWERDLRRYERIPALAGRSSTPM
ncbi:hypothetical protein ACTGJ9_020930 [Bradyrhizobium sp. RDM12]